MGYLKSSKSYGEKTEEVPEDPLDRIGLKQKSAVFTKLFCLYIIKPCQIWYDFMKITLFLMLHLLQRQQTQSTKINSVI